jgi:hypothetical protein
MFHLPVHPRKTYPVVNRCIYCGSSKAWSKEHIIPEGLGGMWVLPQSSCQICASKTSLFERTCQRTMLGPLRMYYDLPSKRKKERPKKLPLKVKLTPDADWTFIDVDREIYPFLIVFPSLPLPDELSGQTTVGELGAAAKTFWIRGASFRDGLLRHLETLAAELHVAAIMPTAEGRVPEFFQMIAKIAHAFSVAELGIDSFSPFLTHIICDGDTSNSLQWIGGYQHTEPPGAALHELSFYADAATCPEVVAVRVRLLAPLETPTYLVAVGRRRHDIAGVAAASNKG